MGHERRARALLLLALLLAAPPARAAEGDPPAIRPLIANGVPTTDGWPEVAMLFNGRGGTCTATLVGCRTLLSAAHCLCSEEGQGEPCGAGLFADPPESVVVFLPRAGLFQPVSIRIAPNFAFGDQGDFAVVELAGPVRGLRPRALNELARAPFGTPATIVGFGITSDGANDAGLLRTGLVATESCNPLLAPGDTHVCWTFAAPVGPAGTDSNTCAGDSGGPLLADLGAGLTLVGVHSGGIDQSCALVPTPSFDADVFVERSWIRSQAGVDLDQTACGDGPQVGDPEVTSLGFSGSSAAESSFHDFVVPAGVRRLRVTLNGIDDPSSDLDLYVGLGARPTLSAFDCASDFTGSFESCELADPPPGTGHVLVHRWLGGTRAYQVHVTMLPEDPPPPPLAGPGLLVAGFSSFELAQVDPADGRRAVVSSALRGGGPDLSGPEGLALDADGSVVVANAFGPSLVRVDRASGARSLVSGCADAACTVTLGSGPPFLGPRFVARGPAGDWLVADRAVPGVAAIVRVDPAGGARTVLSGCADASCSTQVGGGPPFGRLFGLALEPAGTLVVADGQAVLRVDLGTGSRTIVSGCSDAACSGVVGAGPAFGEPVDLVVEPGGGLLVSYRLEGGEFGALRRVDPVTGDRTLVSGCETDGCAGLRGAGPAFADLFGLAAGPAGAIFASDSVLDAVLRVDLATGDRTLLSGCADPSCTAAAGAGPFLGEAVDLVAVPAPGAGPGGLLALGVLGGLARWRPGRRGRGRGGR